MYEEVLKTINPEGNADSKDNEVSPTRMANVKETLLSVGEELEPTLLVGI